MAPALRLWALSDSDREDQVHVAAWRCAIQWIRHAVTLKAHWLDAVNAVELALNLPVPNRAQQAQLYDELFRRAQGLRGTPIEALTMAMLLQAPDGAVPAALRDEVVNQVLATRFGTAKALAPTPASTLFACIVAQNFVDDERLALTPLPAVRPSIAWHDLTLTHRSLLAAVPLGKALVADVDRTGNFVLTLVHEVGHAFALLGPLGSVVAGFRAAAHYLEFVLMDLHAEGQAADPLTAKPLRALSDRSGVAEIARNQSALVWRSNQFAASWSPWLEGVSLYLELLCDPAETTEILSPFEAVRSLVDFSASREEGESVDAFGERLGREIAAEFEAFASAALRRHSRLRHLNALAAPAEGRVYLPGYLAVRAMVARWEATLGRRLKPSQAAKLLLGATRNGCGPAVPPLSVAAGNFAHACRQGVRHFLKGLSELAPQTLEVFLEETPTHEAGMLFAWEDGVPVPRDQVTDPTATHEAKGAAILDEVTAIALGAPRPEPSSMGFEAWQRRRAEIQDLCEMYKALSRLLPVGKDDARMILFDRDQRGVLAPRTYAGLEASTGDLSLPRYSIRSFPATSEELARIRHACGKTGSARATVTRVIDLQGHPDSPLARANMSYVYAEIGETWNELTLGYGLRSIDEGHESFKATLSARLNPLPFFSDEVQTLASLEFLTERLRAAHPNGAALTEALLPTPDVAEEAAWTLAIALNLPLGTVAQALNDTLANGNARGAVSNHLWATGARQRSDAAKAAAASALGALVFDAQAHSGITPFWRKP